MILARLINKNIFFILLVCDFYDFRHYSSFIAGFGRDVQSGCLKQQKHSLLRELIIPEDELLFK